MKIIATLLSVLMFASAFGAEKPWVTINEGFQFLVPADWKKKKVQGIDSHVGHYQAAFAYLEFDELFGLGYTSERSQKAIDDLKKKQSDPKLLKVGEEIWHVDGRIARFTFSKVDPKIFGQREHTNVASLFVPYEGQDGYLSVHLFYASEDYLTVARQILRSFKWPKKENSFRFEVRQK